MVGPSNYSVVTAGRSANFAPGTARDLANGGVSWALNQVLNAQAIRLPNGNTALRIDGAIYTPVGGQKFEPGTMRQLQVTALDPVIKLTVIKEGGGSIDSSLRLLPVATQINLNNSQWASQISSHPNKFASLLSLLHRPPNSISQQLSPQALASMQQIANWLPAVSDLRHNGRLRALFEEFSGISRALSEPNEPVSKSSLSALIGNLKLALQAQLRSIAEPNSQVLSLRPYQGDFASQKAIASTLLMLLDSAIQHHGSMQRRPSAPWLPWGFSFPYVERDQAQIFSLKARRKEVQGSASQRREFWRISCACQFQLLGIVLIQVGLSESKCKIQLKLENGELLPTLNAQTSELSTMLEAMNITLVAMQCSAATEEELRERINWEAEEALLACEVNASMLPGDVAGPIASALEDGRLPELREFEMTGSDLSPSEVNSLPETAYNILASVFVLLLSIEENY
ncbi:MAG: hypothetical protein MI746_05700 [Pseudomonadales bacterium]|nr:hypothetical protein [Pseudomonadales bacterium]